MGTSPILKKDTVAKPEVFKHFFFDHEASRTQETPSPFVRVDHNRDPTPILHEELSETKEPDEPKEMPKPKEKEKGYIRELVLLTISTTEGIVLSINFTFNKRRFFQ